MSQHSVLPALLGAAVLAVSCNSASPATPTASTTFTSDSSVSISAKALAPVKTLRADCPTVTPFTVPLLITVTPGPSVVVVTGITTQFTDVAGLQLPPVTLPAPVPITQFGTALDQARNAQGFSVTVDFGCGTARQGTVGITVGTRDMAGRSATERARVAID